MKVGDRENARSQADGKLLVEPGLRPIQDVIHLIVVILGNVTDGPGIQAHRPGAQGQGLGGGQQVLGFEIAVIVTLEHASRGHGLYVALGPVVLDVREGSGSRGSRRSGYRQRQGHSQGAGEQSFPFHCSAPPCTMAAGRAWPTSGYHFPV